MCSSCNLQLSSVRRSVLLCISISGCCELIEAASKTQAFAKVNPLVLASQARPSPRPFSKLPWRRFNMGNTASSTIPATEVLRVTASEEKERGGPAPATDQSVPGDEDLGAGLLMLGVDIGDAPMPGEKPSMTA